MVGGAAEQIVTRIRFGYKVIQSRNQWQCNFRIRPIQLMVTLASALTAPPFRPEI